MDYNAKIEGYIGSWTRYMIADTLNRYQNQTVHISINSYGGDVAPALGICSLIKEHGNVICDFVAGFSASAATICAMGAKKVRMSKYALLLIHKCSSEQFVWEQMNEDELGRLITELQKQQVNQQKIDNIIANLYCERSGAKHDDIVNAMKEAAWHTADECIKLGIIDEIISDDPVPISDEVKNYIRYNSLPELPKCVDEWIHKPSFLQKIIGLRKTNIINMIKKWTYVNKALNIEGFDVEDSAPVELSCDQMQAINDRMASDAKSIEDITKERDDLKKKIGDLDEEVKNLKDKVSTLEEEPGGETHTVVEDSHTTEIDDEKLFQNLKDFV